LTGSQQIWTCHVQFSVRSFLEFEPTPHRCLRPPLTTSDSNDTNPSTSQSFSVPSLHIISLGLNVPAHRLSMLSRLVATSSLWHWLSTCLGLFLILVSLLCYSTAPSASLFISNLINRCLQLVIAQKWCSSLNIQHKEIVMVVIGQCIYKLKVSTQLSSHRIHLLKHHWQCRSGSCLCNAEKFRFFCFSPLFLHILLPYFFHRRCQ